MPIAGGRICLSTLLACEVCGNQFAYAKVKKSQPDKRTCSKKCSYALRKWTRHVIHDPIEKECHICSKRWNDIHACLSCRR